MQATKKRKVSFLDLLATKLPKDIINYHIAPYFGADLQARKEVINQLNHIFNYYSYNHQSISDQFEHRNNSTIRNIFYRIKKPENYPYSFHHPIYARNK
jgi:hypothetical protein